MEAVYGRVECFKRRINLSQSLTAPASHAHFQVESSSILVVGSIPLRAFVQLTFDDISAPAQAFDRDAATFPQTTNNSTALHCPPAFRCILKRERADARQEQDIRRSGDSRVDATSFFVSGLLKSHMEQNLLFSPIASRPERPRRHSFQLPSRATSTASRLCSVLESIAKITASRSHFTHSNAASITVGGRMPTNSPGFPFLSHSVSVHLAH